MLTEEQAETIENPDEHKLICALPGSGKTHTFISLVDAILKEDVAYQVLMVTFTNASAKEMFDRIGKRLGRAKARRVKAATFASLMLSQFKTIANNRKVIIGAEQTLFVRRALHKAKVKYEEDDIDTWVSTIERIGRNPMPVIPENEKSVSFRVFQTYTEIITQYKRFDLNMMGRELIQGINEGVVPCVSSTHILVDEFQDTDLLQYEWLVANAKFGKKIAVVGDDDQSIYSWRGAMGYTAFVKFQQEFEASGYLLSMCFRCKGNILHSAREFIERNEDRIHKEMLSFTEGEGIVKLLTVPGDYMSKIGQKKLTMDRPEVLEKALAKANRKKSEKKEKEEDIERFRFVAERIQQSGKGGWAVLGRTNKHLDVMEQAFSELNIETKRIGGKSIFDNEHAIGIVSLFMAVVGRHCLTELSTGLSWIGESEENIKDIYISSQLYGFVGSQVSHKKGVKRQTQYFKELAQNSSQVTERNTVQFIEQFFKAINRVIHIKKDPSLKFQIILSDVCKSIVLSMDGTLQQKANGLFTRTQKKNSNNTEIDKDVVVLATMNGSKGLEFPRVWCIEIEDGKMPSIKEASEEALEEERRLMYVAMTRAEDELYISYRDRKESQFIEEIKGTVVC